MEIRVVSEKVNTLLKRREVEFVVEHENVGSTPPRLEVRKAIAAMLKTDVDRVFIKRFTTRTGTRAALGMANVYDSLEQAKRTEPDYTVKRNIPPEKPKEEEKAQ